MTKHIFFILFCIPSTTYSLSLPEWVKTAAGVGYTTLSKSNPEARKEVLNGSLPTSTHRMGGTAAAALIASLVTNKLFESHTSYRLLDKATRNIVRRYTRLPPWSRKHVMPTLTLIASSVFYTALFQAIHEPACSIEEEVKTSLEKELELKEEQKKRPE